MNFSVGLAALRASQFALNTVSQNLANANTQGYHRQRVNFQSRLPQFIEGHFIGSGVDVGTIDRMRSQILESSYTRSVSDLSGAERQWSLEGQIESLFLPGDGSIHNVLGRVLR
jgi:flagellar hook-associated protein 1 FlgK